MSASVSRSILLMSSMAHALSCAVGAAHGMSASALLVNMQKSSASGSSIKVLLFINIPLKLVIAITQKQSVYIFYAKIDI